MRVLRPAALLLVSLAALGCPIQRPALPESYLEFRADLQEAVADVAADALRGRPRVQETLRDELTVLSAFVEVDPLLEHMASQGDLRTLSERVGAAVQRVLKADDLDGGVREGFAKPEGQRLAVDAVVVGLGRALWRLGEGRRESPSDR